MVAAVMATMIARMWPFLELVLQLAPGERPSEHAQETVTVAHSFSSVSSSKASADRSQETALALWSVGVYWSIWILVLLILRLLMLLRLLILWLLLLVVVATVLLLAVLWLGRRAVRGVLMATKTPLSALIARHVGCHRRR